SIASMSEPTFGRDSARMIGSKSIRISNHTYTTLMRSRLLSTRGSGDDISNLDMNKLLSELDICREWMNNLCMEVEKNG
ncbi:MAG: hypothetical protein OXC62_01255, partial [Aestuariivita sp.]|nr:hypothetical protein [Aestuariivita sp.]